MLCIFNIIIWKKSNLLKEIEFEKIFLLGNKNSVNLRIKVYKVV